MNSSELCWLSIAEASELIASGELSPVELIDAHLERIERTDGALNSFITVMAEQASAEARAAEDAVRSGGRLGPLHGIPVGLKDLYYTRGVRTGIGSRILADFVPDYDAGVTESFRDAGAVLMGKLQMHEFALGASSENPHDGDAHNPWDTSRITGGSSGGSGSSVASGQCMAALGSDTGGSIRIPSSFCGIVGLKPTFGRVSRHGVYPLAFSLDTAGPMTRTALDAGLVLNAIAGHDPRDPSSADRPVERLHGGDTGRRRRPTRGTAPGILLRHHRPRGYAGREDRRRRCWRSWARMSRRCPYLRLTTRYPYPAPSCSSRPPRCTSSTCASAPMTSATTSASDSRWARLRPRWTT